MKKKYRSIHLVFGIMIFTLICVFSISLTSQENKTEEGKESELKDDPGTYLDRHKAIKDTQRMKVQTIRDIHRLKTLVTNFGDKVEGSKKQYDEIKDTYKKAQMLWYKRHYIKASILHKKCRTMVFSLYKKFSEMYDKQASQLLAECSEALVNIEFEQSLEPGKEVDLNILVERSSYKMNTAFQQNQLAAKLSYQKRYGLAINHFRLAKLFAIDVLKNLESNPEKQNQLDDKYKIDVLDAKGFSKSALASDKN